MNRLTDNDKNFGPFTFAKWNKVFAFYLKSGDDENKESYILAVAFGRAIRMRVWNWLCKPWPEKWVECNWNAETIKRLGRTGYWVIKPRKFGFSLSDMGNGYDFLQVFYGPQTDESSTEKSWSKFLPWKQWRFVRHSLFNPNNSLAWSGGPKYGWNEFDKARENCAVEKFQFEDCDGEKIIATCRIEEREWQRGEGWFKWLKFFYRPKMVRSLNLSFSSEIGPEKGSWKGGTIGHGIDMFLDETPESAFRRYCNNEHRARGNRMYNLKFIGKYHE